MSVSKVKIKKRIEQIISSGFADDVVLGYIENSDFSNGFVLAKVFETKNNRQTKKVLVINEGASFDQINEVLGFICTNEFDQSLNKDHAFSGKKSRLCNKKMAFGLSKPSSVSISCLKA